jgi:hypothetical protein
MINLAPISSTRNLILTKILKGNQWNTKIDLPLNLTKLDPNLLSIPQESLVARLNSLPD